MILARDSLCAGDESVKVNLKKEHTTGKIMKKLQQK